MRWKNARMLLISVLLIYSTTIRAQSCSYFPADCPGNMQSKDQTFCNVRFIISQEISMQDMIRDFMTDQMETLAKAKNWDVYELDEDADGECLIPADKMGVAYPVPYPLRAPHGFTISFIFIVNTDTLNAWKEWYYNDFLQSSTKMVNDWKSNLSDPSFQATQQTYMDSAQYWSNLLTDYMTKNYEAFSKAAVSNDQVIVNRYNSTTKEYQKHIDYWTSKAANLTKETTASSDLAREKFDKEAHIKTDAFRNNTIIRVKYEFNKNVTSVTRDGELRLVKQLQVPEALLAQIYHNSKTDDHASFDQNQFYRCTDLAYLLFGKWNMVPDKFKQYHAQFMSDKKNTDKITVKSVPCDKIQTIAVHIEGRPDHIEAFLKQLNTEKLTELITK